MVEKIIDPVDPVLIEQELTPERFLRRTNKADNVIYVVDAKCAPHTMREIGRLREISFRASGGGTGKACDIDEFDLMAPPCRQLLVWNPHKREIIGAYRFIAGNDIKTNADGSPRIAMGHMFRFSPAFMRDYLPVTIELGRSFVRPEYQSTHAGVKAIFALDNLWDGLGALTVVHPEMKYLMGKMTMYPAYRHDCRNLLLAFLNLYFPDPDVLVRPIDPLETNADEQELESFFAGNDFKEDYRRLNAYIRDHGINIPPLVNAYMSLSPKMRMFGTAINHEFGEVEESGIFFKIDEIANQKKSRHIDTYIKDSM
ncbi:GNAT family N-acetyltransferase [Sodaliphilus pleomorphus]|uniref:GNAT family N-acetyltransferase n=1 Tax=Sodaliphilus pleomorphus TaxID=2606626 RepID=UPI002409C81D|nr:GNAT family N-acetyltransferase [Sodaliphilus pleomorphus]MDD6687446.1 GNAT family N-acetyltransferase [Sodaliphilus pleomorphus]